MHTRVGITRRVFITSRWAIKVPRLTNWGGGNKARGSMWSLTRGIQANLSELEWSGIDGVNPVVRSWLGGLVQIYRRATPVRVDDLTAAGLIEIRVGVDVPVRDDGDLLSVEVFAVGQGRVVRLPAGEQLAAPAVIEAVIDWESICSTAPMPGDRKLSNLGVVRGRVVWIDFDQSWNACPHHPSEMCRPFD